MNRRVESNHALLDAVQLANHLDLPVLYYEGLTCSDSHASDRMHTFVLEGVPETSRRLARLGIGYVFHLTRRQADPDDALFRLAGEAAAVVTDDFPTGAAVHHNASLPGKLKIPYHVVDSSCVVPMSRMEKREYAAYTIRPKIRRLLGEYLTPAEPPRVGRRYTWPAPDFHTLVSTANIAALVASCEIDHRVPPSRDIRGGRLAAEKQLEHFLEHKLRRYARERNNPVAHATSGLSPYLHFGQISSLEVALAVKEYAAAHKLIAEEFLEELIVRRELAFNHARYSERPESLENLPEWVRKTLARHAADRRSPVYAREQLEGARTHDPLWNATQRELLQRGVIHGYYRMYWGKKVIEWSASCEEALETMVYLHHRWALDGRDPNTYTNILWCFGLHDRPWRERPIFGMVRYMSLEGMRRKTDVDGYIREMSQ
jgi:deoxyribodipyrimidine photo-lyase